MTVTICGIPHTVTLVDDSRVVDHDNATNNLHGQIDHGKSSIRIASNAPAAGIAESIETMDDACLELLGLKRIRR